MIIWTGGDLIFFSLRPSLCYSLAAGRLCPSSGGWSSVVGGLAESITVDFSYKYL